MGSSKITIVGAPCGEHGSYTFYKAFKYSRRGTSRILSLSEFFFVKISSIYPVSIGELQLIWTEKSNDTLLCSLRLYFLPENTPDGRTETHGQDEVLASAEKLVLKAEDLVDWVTVCPDWMVGTPGVCNEELPDGDDNLMKSFAANNSGLKLTDVKEEKKLIGEADESDPQITILSYPRYLRFRGILKRLGHMKDKWLKNAVVAAIGGFTVTKKNSWVLFCKDTFDSADLEGLEERCDHLAPSLKGRPRKKKRLSKDGSFSCSEESEEQESPIKNGQCSNGRKPGRPNRLVLHSNKVGEEKVFFMALNKFMNRRNTPISRMPSLGFKKVDLFVFYSSIKKLGGYKKVCEKRLWKHTYDKLGGHVGNTSAATCTRRHYEKLLLPFELHQHDETQKHQAKIRAVTNRAVNKAKKVQLHKQVHEEEKWEQRKRKIPGRRAQTLSEKEQEWELIRKQNALKRVQSKYSLDGVEENKPVVASPAKKPAPIPSTNENSSKMSPENNLVRQIELSPENNLMRQIELSRRREALHRNNTEHANINPSQPMLMIPGSPGMVSPLRVPIMQQCLPNMPFHPHGAMHPGLFRPGLPVQSVPYMMGQFPRQEFKPSNVHHHVPVPDSGSTHIPQNRPSPPKPPPAHSHKVHNPSRPSVIQHTQNKGPYSMPPKTDYPAIPHDNFPPANSRKPQPFVPGRTDKPRQKADPYYKNMKRQRLNEELATPPLRAKPLSERENLPPTVRRHETNNDMPTDLSMKTLKAKEEEVVAYSNPQMNNGPWIDIPVYVPQSANAPLNLRRSETPSSSGRSSSTPTGRASIPPPPRVPSSSSYDHSPITLSSGRKTSRDSPYFMDVTPPPHGSPALPTRASPAHHPRSSPASHPRESPSSLPRTSPSSVSRGSSVMTDNRHAQLLTNGSPLDPSSMALHPAFLQPQINQHLAMTQGLFPSNSPTQLQRMYEAQMQSMQSMQSMQAGAAHMAFYGEMLQHPMFAGHDQFLRPPFSPQMQREGAFMYRK